MPDENRSDERWLSERNEPQLQRAVLEVLLDLEPKQISIYQLADCEPLQGSDLQAVISAAVSLHLAALVNIDEAGRVEAGPMARHFHWLMTEVEPLNE
jgi:hypothetical protein